MNQNVFVNEAINEGIKQYLQKTNEEEYTTIIIKTLISIYGELDIINPYKTNTESGMGSFDENLTKFGYSKENLSLFKQNVMHFYLSKETKPNVYFNEIQKELIDMFFQKYEKVNKENANEQNFFACLQIEETLLNNLYSTDKKEIKRYYNYKKRKANSQFEYEKVKNQLLMEEAYEMTGYSFDKIKKMNEKQLTDTNRKVYAYFKIDINRQDKDLRLEQALSYYKMFPKPENKNNGYIEFLLLSGFIAVSLLIITVVVGVLIR